MSKWPPKREIEKKTPFPIAMLTQIAKRTKASKHDKCWIKEPNLSPIHQTSALFKAVHRVTCNLSGMLENNRKKNNSHI